MTVSEIDIYRSAQLLLEQYGLEGALIRAAMRVDELLNAGDLVGRDVWQRIRKAISELCREREPGDAVN